MALEDLLRERSGSKCELCGGDSELAAFPVSGREEQGVFACATCRMQISGGAPMDANHWFCLGESMWSEHAPVKVLVHRVLKKIGNSWAQDLLGQMYLEENDLAWAENLVEPTVDSNGTALQSGDSVTLIKDLEVKGANFTAKRGTTVKGITVGDDPRYVEGRVNGIRIVLVAAYLKKA